MHHHLLFEIRNHDVYTASGEKAGFIDQNDLFDAGGVKVAFWDGDDVFNASGVKIAFLEGGSVYAGDGRRLIPTHELTEVIRGEIDLMARVAVYVVFGA